MRNRQPKPGQIGKYSIGKKSGRKGPQDAWCTTWYDERTRQTRYYSLGTADFQEASLKHAGYVLLKDKPKDADAADVLISTCLLAYWEERGKALISWRTTKYHLRLWTEFWGERAVSEITREEQAKFRKFMGEGRLAPSTIDKILSTGNAAFNLAKQSGMLREIPKIVLIETEEDRRDRKPMATPITPIYAARLLDAVKSQHLFAFIMIIASTLARNGAVYDMRREQFNEEDNVLRLNPRGRRQNKKYRATVLVTPTLRRWLMHETNPEAYYLFHAGKRVKNIKKAWETAVQEAGLPKGFTPYSFRHGIARAMRTRGVPTEQISHFLGHLPRGGAKTTSIYAPMEAQDCKQAAAAIEDVLTEIRGLVKIANLDDPNALLVADENGRLRDGSLGQAKIEELSDLIRAGTGVTEICRRIGVSNTLVYRYRKRITGRTKA